MIQRDNFEYLNIHLIQFTNQICFFLIFFSYLLLVLKTSNINHQKKNIIHQKIQIFNLN